MSHEEDPSAPEAPPATAAQLLELAREQSRNGRHDAAMLTLAELLAREPAHAGGNAQMAEVYFSQQRIAEAGTCIEAALLKTPNSPRLHILRGEMLRANQRFEEADTAFANALAIDRSRAGAWSGRIGLALDCRQWAVAVTHLRDGLDATGDMGLWLGAVRVLREAGAMPALLAAVELRPAPDIADHGRFLPWAREVLRAGEGAQVIAALAAVPEGLPANVRAEYHALKAEVARAAGDFWSALQERRRAHALLPDDRGGRRQLLRALLAVGDLAAAENELKALASGRAPQDDVAEEVNLLQEARIFQASMQQLNKAFLASESPSPATLAQIVEDEPGCLFAAIALLAALRRQPRALDEPGVQPLIPARFWSLESPADGWEEHHPGAQWQALAYAPLPPDIAAAMPMARQALRRLPWDMQVDVLRATTLGQAGGWWYPAGRNCHGSLQLLAGAGTRLFLVCDSQGWLLPDCIGCCAGDPAIAVVRALIDDVLRGQAPRGSSRWHTGAVLLTLGVARVLAGRVLAGAPLGDVRILDEAAFRRRIA